MHRPDDTIVIRKSSACGPTSLSFEAFSDDLLGQIAGAFQYRYRRGVGRSTVERRRTWRERLCSWPWRPWEAWTEVAAWEPWRWGQYEGAVLDVFGAPPRDLRTLRHKVAPFWWQEVDPDRDFGEESRA